MRLAGLIDIPKIIKILRASMTQKEMKNQELNVSARMRVPGTLFFLDPKDSMCIIIEPLGSNNKAQYHMYTDGAKRKDTLAFVREATEWVLNNTHYDLFIGFTPKENKPARVFARALGYKKIGNLEFDSGVNEEITMITRDMLKEVL